MGTSEPPVDELIHAFDARLLLDEVQEGVTEVRVPHLVEKLMETRGLTFEDARLVVYGLIETRKLTLTPRYTVRVEKRHNHMTRVILPWGECPMCDEYHMSHPRSRVIVVGSHDVPAWTTAYHLGHALGKVGPYTLVHTGRVRFQPTRSKWFQNMACLARNIVQTGGVSVRKLASSATAK